MRDEARNTASHHPVWGRDARLRHQPVAFISAGVTEPLKHLPVQPASFEDSKETGPPRAVPVGSQNPPSASTTARSDVSPEAVPVHVSFPTLTQEPHMTPSSVAQRAIVTPLATGAAPASRDVNSGAAAGFFFDLEGDKSLSSVHHQVAARSSDEDSDSSEDVVLFKGRAHMARARVQEKARASKTYPPAAASDPLPPHGDSAASATAVAQFSTPRHVQESTLAPSRESQLSQDSSWHMQALSKREEEAALIADYIANMEKGMEDETEEYQTFDSTRDLGGDEGALGLGSGPASRAESRASASEQDLARQREEAQGESEGDDEALAKLLAKQEELGLGSDELLLFSDSYTKVGKHTRHRSLSSRKASKISHTLKGSFASAKAVAEALDNLDLRDNPDKDVITRGLQDRRAPTFDVSDSELEARLQAAWITDRERKKNRKMEREELRARGLLGKNVDPDDLQTKYQAGMTLENIKEELRAFILGADEQLHFPPMDKQARKMLHELAGKFKIKSLSTGNGDQRRPVLSKTKRTVTYATHRADLVVEHVEAASARIRRKYFHRADDRGSHGHGSKDTGLGRSGGKAVSYREGEIVGGAAPELGQENKGHAMLEKMGWSKGMALGAVENQGILEPVAQVVKRSKAGLG